MIADLPGGATVNFAPALNGAIIALGGSQIFIDKELTIDAAALTSSVTISGDATGNGPTPDDYATGTSMTIAAPITGYTKLFVRIRVGLRARRRASVASPLAAGVSGRSEQAVAMLALRSCHVRVSQRGYGSSLHVLCF